MQEIITDGGQLYLQYGEAAKFFHKDEIMDWWEDIRGRLNLESTEDGTPEEVPCFVAKAVYKDEKWIKIISLGNFGRFPTSCEEEAIKLGEALRKELQLDDGLIINDNEEAVNNQKAEINVEWRKQEFMMKAEKLDLRQAKKVIS